jgi:sialate O-acetylesterase
LNDVLFGDVWICSGQSNMGFTVNRMFNASIEIENAYRYSKIRLFSVGDSLAFTPQEELITIAMHWSIASNISVPHTSAVCWLYGRMVQEALGGRPMSLIHTSRAGTAIELWTTSEVLKDCDITQ